MKIKLFIILLIVLNASFSQARNSDWSDLRTAREFFSKGQLDKAYSYYSKIPQSSDYWLEATEEKAHLMGRKGDYAKTISLLQTLLVPTFDGVIGPEPYFVAALTQLKICDYSSVLETTKQFKDRYQSRMASLGQIKNKQSEDVINQLVVKKNLDFTTIGALTKKLPRQFNRDKKINYYWKNRSTETGRIAIADRLSQLAKSELNEIEKIINKLHIIEAEVIHRVHLIDRDGGNRPTQGNYEKDGEVLIFPFSKEIWIDELDSFVAKIEKCPTLKKRASL